ncbi:MAG: tRNA (N6-threonylcarbamoyladenosine(37)-N6)-methyltransferase TrmO, partial [Calditrichaeota bacterium]
QVQPYLDSQMRGLFSTRAPSRPNPIGISIVRLKQIEDTSLIIEDLDILDGTPLLDIKPFVPNFDRQTGLKIGWLEDRIEKLPGYKADNRFKNKDPERKNKK